MSDPIDQDPTSTFKAEADAYRYARVAYWDSVNSRPVQRWSAYYRERLLVTYGQLISESASVLELGCGRGALLAGLKPKVGVGVDFSGPAVRAARQNYPHLEFIESDVVELDLGGRTFDYVVISELVNDLWDVQLLLGQIHRYCKPETRVIFNFYSHLWNLPLTAAQKLGIATRRLDQNWLAPQDMRNLLEISGFQPLRSGYLDRKSVV